MNAFQESANLNIQYYVDDEEYPDQYTVLHDCGVDLKDLDKRKLGCNYQVFGEERDDPDYFHLRELAQLEAKKRHSCFKASQAAYHNCEGARAKELSIEGKEHGRLMKKYNKQAADLVFQLKNAHRPPTEIDLHGLFVAEASEKVKEAIQTCRQMQLDHLVIIVGRGQHSPGRIAKLKPAIVEILKQYQVSVEPNQPNLGCLLVKFGSGVLDPSWLNRWV